MMASGKSDGAESTATWYQNSCGSKNAMAGCTMIPTATDEKKMVER